MPTANMEEIIPAARLLSRATALTHSDYERAKSAFLSGMDASGLAAQVIRWTQTIPCTCTHMCSMLDSDDGLAWLASLSCALRTDVGASPSLLSCLATLGFAGQSPVPLGLKSAHAFGYGLFAQAAQGIIQGKGSFSLGPLCHQVPCHGFGASVIG